MMTGPFSSQHVLVVGLAREGTTAAVWLAERGAQVTGSDMRAPVEGQRLEAAGVDLRIGAQTPDLLETVDAVVASPGVPQDHPLFAGARGRGIPITTETRLLAQGCPAPIVGITGSSGKTTTTTLTHKILETAGVRAWLGGNIGAPLLGREGEMRQEDRVVLELSSFQLLYWRGRSGLARATDGVPWHDPCGISPHIAAVLNITPNHLDRHPSMAHYIAAKATLLAYQTTHDFAVLNRDDAVTAPWAETRQVTVPEGAGQPAEAFPLAARTLTFGLSAQSSGDGAWHEDGWVWMRWHGEPTRIIPRRDIRLRGQHNLANILASCCLATAAGAESPALSEAIASFRGVDHRLEVVCEMDGVTWVNDSIATSPERSQAALFSFDEPIILLAGGRDKHLPWDAWAAAAHKRARYVITFGEAASLITGALASTPAESRLAGVLTGGDLAQAVALAASVAQSGDVVLLSPGGTSYDAYIDFAARGRHFCELVNAQTATYTSHPSPAVSIKP